MGVINDDLDQDLENDLEEILAEETETILQLSALQMMILKDFKTSSSDSTDSEDDDVEDLFTYPIESN